MLVMNEKEIVSEITNSNIFRCLMNTSSFFKSNGDKIFEELIGSDSIIGRYDLVHEWLDNCRTIFPMVGIIFVYKNNIKNCVDIYKYNKHIITMESNTKINCEVEGFKKAIRIIERDRATAIIKSMLNKYIEAFEAINKLKIHINCSRYGVIEVRVGSEMMDIYNFLCKLRSSNAVKRKKLIELLLRNGEI